MGRMQRERAKGKWQTLEHSKGLGPRLRNSKNKQLTVLRVQKLRLFGKPVVGQKDRRVSAQPCTTRQTRQIGSSSSC